MTTTRFPVQIPRVVILDFDETLGSFTQDIPTLITLAHALYEDPVLRGQSLDTKKRILVNASHILVRHNPRQGVPDLLMTLYLLKLAGLVKGVYLITKARKSSEPLFVELKTSPQQLLLEGLLHIKKIPARLIDEIRFAEPLATAPKELRGFGLTPLWVLDDLSLAENYISNPKLQDVEAYQVAPYFGGEEKTASSLFWQQVMERLLKRYSANEVFAASYLKALAKQVQANHKRLQEKRKEYAKQLSQTTTRPQHSIQEAEAELLRVLRTRACKNDQACEAYHQECSPYGFCVDVSKATQRIA